MLVFNIINMDYIDTIDDIFSNLYNKYPNDISEIDNMKMSILYILLNKNKSAIDIFDSIKPKNFSIIKNN
jgi:hypothetical protein